MVRYQSLLYSTYRSPAVKASSYPFSPRIKFDDERYERKWKEMKSNLEIWLSFLGTKRMQPTVWIELDLCGMVRPCSRERSWNSSLCASKKLGPELIVKIQEGPASHLLDLKGYRLPLERTRRERVRLVSQKITNKSMACTLAAIHTAKLQHVARIIVNSSVWHTW